MKLNGRQKRTERAIETYLRMWRDYNDPFAPLSVMEIVTKYRKKDGSMYTRSAVYKGFARLEELNLV